MLLSKQALFLLEFFEKSANKSRTIIHIIGVTRNARTLERKKNIISDIRLPQRKVILGLLMKNQCE
jgi:hypothetical protein